MSYSISIHTLLASCNNFRKAGFPPPPPARTILDSAARDFPGHADLRTTLTHIRSRDRLSQSPAYVLKY